MGCFNHKCNFSNLPVVWGDRIVVIIGFTQQLVHQDNFSPGCSFVPISVPIRGRYNEYGGIEDVDMTPSIEVLERYFDMDVYHIVDIAERTTSGCEHQMEEENGKVLGVLENIAKESGYTECKLKISYVMEHESIFDYLVSTANLKMKDREFWRIPHKYIEALGYKKENLGKENGYEFNKWTHDTLPTLKENCHLWLENEFGQFDKISHSIAELCKRIRCEVPEKFEESFFENVFKNEVSLKDKEKLLIEYYKSLVGKHCKNGVFSQEDVDKLIKEHNESTPEEKEDDYLILDFVSTGAFENYSFKRHYENYGLFHFRSGMIMTNSILSQFGNKDEHLDLKYMKEVIEIASIIDALDNLQMTWGVTSYYRQYVNYDQHIDFLNECLKVAKEKKEKNEK